MRWKLFAILAAVSYVWAILTGFNGVARSQFRMVGDACIGLFATIGVLLYAFERQLLSEQFWSWLSRLYLVWICLWLAVFLVRFAIFYSANTDLLSAKKMVVLLFGYSALLWSFDSFQWLALARHAKGEMLK